MDNKPTWCYERAQKVATYGVSASVWHNGKTGDYFYFWMIVMLVKLKNMDLCCSAEVILCGLL